MTYEFPLEPDYFYILKTVAYHQNQDRWKMKVMIDGEEVAEIEYEAGIPESRELVISPEFYTDSIISVSFECDDGDFAAVGPVYIYRYESETMGGKTGTSNGPMAQKSSSSNSGSIAIFPNPFNYGINISFPNQTGAKFSIKVYDVTGRLIQNIYDGPVYRKQVLNWNGKDENGTMVSQGIYFLRIRNYDSGDTFCMKVLKIK